jgi:hypothetical protein
VTKEVHLVSYYVMCRDLEQLAGSLGAGTPSSTELDEIDSIRRMIVEIESEVPTFSTTT